MPYIPDQARTETTCQKAFNEPACVTLCPALKSCPLPLHNQGFRALFCWELGGSGEGAGNTRCNNTQIECMRTKITCYSHVICLLDK